MAGTLSLDILDRIEIASPCPMRWEDMEGDARRRMCDQCGLHVHNIEGLTREEAVELIASSAGKRVCVRLHRRTDGAVMTHDCPVGRRALHRRAASGAWRLAAAALCLLTGGLLFARVDHTNGHELSDRQPMRAVRAWLRRPPPPVPPAPPPNPQRIMLGRIVGGCG
ncbi:MAG: hypothetical protein H6811_03530 [Phycisphaeraceae bacterium]|nr:hypothetical protein [Phycisphaeraceae bacterium]